jgi:hypothetical protein
VATAVRVPIVSVWQVCLSSTTTVLAVTAFKHAPSRISILRFTRSLCAKAASDAVTWQDALAALKQYQPQIALRYVVVRPQPRAKNRSSPHAFDAGKSAAGNDECQSRLRLSGSLSASASSSMRAN